MKWLTGFVLVLALGCASSPWSSKDERDVLTVASDLDNAPFAFRDSELRPRGRDVEMMRALAEALGMRLKWRRMPFEELLPAVEAGEVDVVCATLGITPERAERVLFTQPYFRTSIAIVTRAGLSEPRTYAELAGRRVSAGAGTTSERALRERLPGAIPVLENEKGLSTAERLLSGEVDAAVMDAPAAEAMVRESDFELWLMTDMLAEEHYALAVRPDGADLVERLNGALEEMVSSKRMNSLDVDYGFALIDCGIPLYRAQ